jgi:hypothetical protein
VDDFSAHGSVISDEADSYLRNLQQVLICIFKLFFLFLTLKFQFLDIVFEAQGQAELIHNSAFFIPEEYSFCFESGFEVIKGFNVTEDVAIFWYFLIEFDPDLNFM